MININRVVHAARATRLSSFLSVCTICKYSEVAKENTTYNAAHTTINNHNTTIANNINTNNTSPKHKGYWSDTNHHKQYLQWLAKKLGIHNQEDWYNVTTEAVCNNGGARMLSYYDGSLYKALTTLYPKHSWLAWRFSQVPRNFWDDVQNHKKYIEWLGGQLGVNELDDWYRVNSSDVVGQTHYWVVEKYHNGSLIHALKAVYPQHPWKMWKFSNIPKGFWDDTQNQRDYFEWIGMQLGLTSLESWYKVKLTDVLELGGRWVLGLYGYSLHKALEGIFPAHSWKPWMFHRAPKGFWDNELNIGGYMKWLAQELSIRSSMDYHNITVRQVLMNKGQMLYQKSGCLLDFFAKYFPKQDRHHTSAFPSKSQALLVKYLQELFPQHDMITNYTTPELLYPQTNAMIELDVFVPDLSLGIEYNGEQHSKWHYLAGKPVTRQHKDQQKKTVCESAGITFVTIPYWWDKTRESFTAIIQEALPTARPHEALLSHA